MQAGQRRQRRTRRSSILPLLLLAPSPSTAFLRSSGKKKDNNTNNDRELNSRAAVKAVKWWYDLNPSLTGGGECVQNADYPDDWPTNFPKLLYTSYDECCANHNDVNCILNVEKDEMWYHLNDSCKFGSDYPDWMGAGLNKWSHLFSSKEDCCQVYTCVDKEARWWPKNNLEDDGFHCAFGTDYPPDFLDHSDAFLFDTEESCCALFCGDPVTTTTTTEAAPVSLAPVSSAPTSLAPMSAAPTSSAPDLICTHFFSSHLIFAY
jgi:hypothetical protein